MTIQDAYTRISNIVVDLMEWEYSDYTDDDYLVFNSPSSYEFDYDDFEALQDSEYALEGMIAVIDYAKEKGDNELLKLIEQYVEYVGQEG